MKGWKTKTGSVLTMIGTLYKMYYGLIDVPTGITVIGAALTAWGIGHKIDKNGLM